MQIVRNWWYGSNGPAYLWYKFIRRVRVTLGVYGLLLGNCAGCGKSTKFFDGYYMWHVCEHCSSDEIAYDLAEHVANPNGDNY